VAKTKNFVYFLYGNSMKYLKYQVAACRERVASFITIKRMKGWAISFLIGFAVLFSYSFISAVLHGRQTPFGLPLGGDFAAFYLSGVAVRHATMTQFYNQELQQQEYKKLLPGEPAGISLPYVHAPFLALLFSVFAPLSFESALIVWIVISTGLFLAGIKLLWRFGPIPPALILTCMSFMPFMIECLAGGQTSAIAFFLICCAITLERRRNHFLSGTVLAGVLYKPTLLILLLPMLLLTRRFRTFTGFVFGSSLLLCISAALLGSQAIVAWLQAMIGFSHQITGNYTLFNLSKYVDLVSFSRMLANDSASIQIGIMILLLSLFLYKIIKSGYIGNSGNRIPTVYDWAVAIAWTPVINVYFGFWDLSLLIIPALILVQGQLQGGLITSKLKTILVLVYLSCWISQPIGRLSGVQLITLVMLFLGNAVLDEASEKKINGAC
jgi:hypothetical protein